jgi:organic radical activating enzyme
MTRIRHARCEVDIVEHCNLSCRACSHLSPVMPRLELAPDDLHRDLSRLWEHYDSNWVALLGGEPLLHRDLVGVIDAVRDAVAPARVSVVTNGTLLPQMSEAFWKAIDGVQVCFYPGKELGRDELRACRAKAAAHGVPMVVTRVDRFRESYSEIGTEDQALVRRIYEACALKTGHSIANGAFYKCPPSYFLPKAIGGLEDEGVRLDASDLGERLRAYLAASEPLSACGNCLGSAGRRFAQTQTARGEFRAHQQRPTEALLDARLLRPPSRWRSRLKRVSPRYYRHERRLM